MRSGPGTDYDVTKTLSTGDAIEVVAKTSNGWFRTVKDTYVNVKLVSSEKPSAPSSSGGSSSAGTVAPGTTDLATYCSQFIGVDYYYTGASPSGFDCSGFVSYVYSNYYGISLPHQSNSISQQGTAISAADVTVGDVICYDYTGDGVVDHVALYVGGGSIIHASSRLDEVVSASLSTTYVTTIRRFI